MQESLSIFLGKDPAKKYDLNFEDRLFILCNMDGSADRRLLPFDCKASKDVPSTLTRMKDILLAANVNIILGSQFTLDLHRAETDYHM